MQVDYLTSNRLRKNVRPHGTGSSIARQETSERVGLLAVFLQKRATLALNFRCHSAFCFGVRETEYGIRDVLVGHAVNFGGPF